MLNNLYSVVLISGSGIVDTIIILAGALAIVGFIHSFGNNEL